MGAARIRAILAAALAAALIVVPAAGAALAAAGTVVGLSGPCFIESGGNRSALALGAAVQVGDTVDVPADGKLKLRMADGSIVALAPGTKLTIKAYAVGDGEKRQDAVLSLGQGLLHAIVAPVEHPARFEVDTAVGSAAVRSTDWFIETSPDGDQVSVLSGSVAVTSAATGHSVLVPARHHTRLQAGRDPLPPRIFSRASFARIIGRTALRGPPARGPDRRGTAPRPAPAEHHGNRDDRFRPHPEFLGKIRQPPKLPAEPHHGGPATNREEAHPGHGEKR